MRQIELIETIDSINDYKQNFGLDQTIKFLELVNNFLLSITKKMIKEGRFKLTIWNFIPFVRISYKFVKDLFAMFPENIEVAIRMATMNGRLADIFIKYLVWIIQNHLRNGKLSLSIFSAFPFALRTYDFVKELIAFFKKK